MDDLMVTIRGRNVAVEVELVEQLLADNPTWGRTHLSRRLCELWNWRGPNGLLKDMACRSLLLRLEKAGHIVLPPRQRRSVNGFRNRSPRWVVHRTQLIDTSLQALLPLNITRVVPGCDDDGLFRCLLSHYHYLGYRNTVGENMRYLVRSAQGEALSCVLFGSPAWQLAARDAFIGWSARARAANLVLVTSNTRFLIVPWVRVAHLASHILSRVVKRLSADWMTKYAHPIYVLETFVESSRHRGTCYRAANWIRIGQTTGRTRSDRARTITAPVKDIYLYPLTRHYRAALCHDG